MKSKLKPFVGQELFLVREPRWRGGLTTYEHVIVEKVGNKYFTVVPKTNSNPYNSATFHIKNWQEKTDYYPYLSLYTSEQGYKDTVEFNEIVMFLYRIFNSHKSYKSISLDNLRKIKNLIDADIKNSELNQG